MTRPRPERESVDTKVLLIRHITTNRHNPLWIAASRGVSGDLGGQPERTRPRQPCTGRPNFATRRSVNGAPVVSTPSRRASLTGTSPCVPPRGRRAGCRSGGGRRTTAHRHWCRGGSPARAWTSATPPSAGRTGRGRCWAPGAAPPPRARRRAHRPRRRTRSTRWGRADHAVAPPARQRAAVYLGDDLQHAVLLLDRRLVERPGPRENRPVQAHDDVDRHALLDLVAALDHQVHHGRQVLHLGLGEEAHVPQVHAEQRHRGRAGQLGGAQQRAVTAQDDDQLGPFQGRVVLRDHLDVGAAQLLGLLVEHPHVDARLDQPFHDEAGAAHGRLPARVRRHQDGPLGIRPVRRAARAHRAHRLHASPPALTAVPPPPPCRWRRPHRERDRAPAPSRATERIPRFPTAPATDSPSRPSPSGRAIPPPPRRPAPPAPAEPGRVRRLPSPRAPCPPRTAV